MKNFVVDNSLKNLGKAVLWQYDRAVRLLSIMKHMQVLFFAAIQQFWAKWMERVLAIDTCGEFGCLVWSILLGLPRPSVEGEDGKLHQIVPSVYRRLLKGKYYLTKATPSAESLQNYLEIVFGIPGREAYSKWEVTQCEYGWHTNVDELNPERPERLQYHVHRAYDKGEIFHFKPYADMGESTDSDTEEEDKFNWLVKEPITEKENKSWEAVSSKVEATDNKADLANEDGMFLLKLYDPNGICRKIAGAPTDALSITAEYVIGDTTVTATVTRRRKSGVAVVDDSNMAMHYEKTEFFTEMHKDQQALFNQRMDDVCPYPLGIKTNEPVEEVVFAFAEQQGDYYESGKAYGVGDVFAHWDEDGVNSFNWECMQPINAVENVSFDAIKDKLKKTWGDNPIVGTMTDETGMGIAAPQFSIYPFKRDGRISTPVVSMEQWPSLSIFYPPGSLAFRNGADVGWFSAFAEFPDNMVVGRSGKMDFIYKIPSGPTGPQVEITDGSTYTAFFGDASAGQGAWNPYFMIVTKELADFYIENLQDVDLNNSIYGGATYAYEAFSQMYSKVDLSNATILQRYETLGLVDAMGKAANKFKWPVVGSRETFNKLMKTTFICNSSLKRIGQGVS